MQLTKDDHLRRKYMAEVCLSGDNLHFCYANFFFQAAPEYNRLLELHCEDKLGKIVGGLDSYDFKPLADAKDRQKENITIKSMEFTQSVFKPQDLNADNVDFVMRLCAIGFYIWFRVAVENPTDLDVMMFFQAKDEDVHTNMTYSLDANTDWGKKQGYRFMDIENYFALYNTALPCRCSFEELYKLCNDFRAVCDVNMKMSKSPKFSQYSCSQDFIRQHRKWCLYLLYFARKAWELTSEKDAETVLSDYDKLPPFAVKKYKEFQENLQEVSLGEGEYFLPDRDMLYERFFVSCIIFVSITEKMIKKYGIKPKTE